MIPQGLDKGIGNNFGIFGIQFDPLVEVYFTAASNLPLAGNARSNRKCVFDIFLSVGIFPLLLFKLVREIGARTQYTYPALLNVEKLGDPVHGILADKFSYFGYSGIVAN